MSTKNYKMNFKMSDGTTKSVPFSMPSGADIDVVAEVGQTIVVEEVDADGKPTKWKAAEYQERTHWSEVAEILPETTLELSDGAWEGDVLPVLTIGNTYKVVWNGTEYICVAKDGSPAGFAGNGVIGNMDAALGTGDTGEPFVIGTMEGFGMMVARDGSTSATLSIGELESTPIPVQYMTNALPYYIEVTGSGTEDDPYVCNDTVVNVNAIFDSGRPLVIKLTATDTNNNQYVYYHPFSSRFLSANSVYIYMFGLWIQSTVNSSALRVNLISQDDGTFTVSTGIVS